MEGYISTTPFGRRPMTLGLIANQVIARAVPSDVAVHKWQAFQDIREARDLLGATDRALAILNALLSFHPETALTGEGDLIVWPSNEQLMARANGMPATTLRRHIAVLVESGLVLRRDSPNGKRFARKDRSGRIEQAYGFDLSPIVARAQEFRDLAETVRAEKKAHRVAKERLTLLRRDIVKLIEVGIGEGVPANWGRVQQTYQLILSGLPRAASRLIIEAICDELLALHAEIREALETFTKTQIPDANESHSGCHIQNSKPDSIFESQKLSEEPEEVTTSTEPSNVRALPKRELPLAIVLDACPNLLEVAHGGQIRSWREFLAAADLARPMLGVSPSAWIEAREAMGELQAAITLAGIYQRADQINNPGGYLRTLSERATEGQFSTWPMIMALLRAKLEAGKQRKPASSCDSFEISEAVRKQLSAREARSRRERGQAG